MILPVNGYGKAKRWGLPDDRDAADSGSLIGSGLALGFWRDLMV